MWSESVKCLLLTIAERAFTSGSTLQRVEAGDTTLAWVFTPASFRHWPALNYPSTFTSGGQAGRSEIADFEVHIDLGGRTRPVGLARTNRNRGTETILFEYDDALLRIRIDFPWSRLWR